MPASTYSPAICHPRRSQHSLISRGCAQEKQKTKTKTNVLDGADFVRDVLDIYPTERKISGEHVQFDGRAGAIINFL